MAKEVDDAQLAADKLSKKGQKANSTKVDNAQEKLGLATSQWESQAPYVFEKLQAVDELRLNHLRDALTQYETHESDQIARSQSTAEATLMSLVEVDVTEEIRNFARKSTSAQGRPKLDTRTSRTSGTGGTSFSRPSNAPSSTLVPPPSRPSADDNVSEHSGRNDGPAESKAKGLKRFGTMLGRRRQSIHGSFQRAPSPSKGFSALSPFGGRNLSSRDGRPSPSPRASSNNLRESPSRENRLSSLVESPTSPTTITSASQADRRRSRDITNGDLNGLTPGSSSLTAEVIPEHASSQITNGALQKDLPDLTDVQPPPGPPPSHQQHSEYLKKDADGFTVPAVPNDPISLAQQEAADENDQQQFKLDIKNEPIQEEGADAQAALANVANTLRSSTLTTPSRKAGTIRGRRDVRNTIYVPSPETSDLSKSLEYNAPPSPQRLGSSRAGALATLTSETSNVSDTQSIRSARSLTSNAAIKHPEMHEPGLNSSIIETVNAYFENGEIKSATVIGELALAYGLTDSIAVSGTNPHSIGVVFKSNIPQGTETIRLNNFPALEAIAPHNTFVNEISTERPGEYTVDLSHIAKTNVAFRYKVHVDDTNLSAYAPLILKPAWKPTGDKLGLVIEYSLNPAFSSSPVQLKNLILMAAYEGARAVGCQTKPTGVHLKEKSLVYWRLGDVTVGAKPQKVIGRLIGAEGGEPKPGLVEARWEIQGPSDHAVGSGLGVSRLDLGKGKEKEESPDPFADDSVAIPSLVDGQWIVVDSLRKVVSGKYDAKQAN